MKKIISIALAVVLLLANSCHSETEQKESYKIGNFDISKDDKYILYNFFSQGGSSIYQANIDGAESKLLISSNKDKSYFNPKYSQDGEKIVFIGYENKNANNCALYIANSDGTNMEQLTEGNEIISEAIFSNYGNNVIYLKANEYKHYSPIGVDQAHDFDIYSIDLNYKKVTKVTNLKSNL